MLRSALLIDDTAQRRVASFIGRASTVNLLPVGDRTPEVPEEPSQKVLIIGDMRNRERRLLTEQDREYEVDA